MITRSVSWLNSPKVRNLMKFLGLNVRKLDDIERLRAVYFDLPPHLRQDWVNDLKKDNPDLYKIWQDYWAASLIVKVMNAKGAKKIELLQKMEAQGFINTFYALEDKQEGAGYDWLKRNPRAQAFLNLHWKMGDKRIVYHNLRTEILQTLDYRRCRSLSGVIHIAFVGHT